MITSRNRLAILFSALYYFLVIAAFWMIKPIRVSLVVEMYGPDIYPWLKQSSILLMPLIFVAYRLLTDRVNEKFMTLALSAGFSALALVFATSFWAGLGERWISIAFYYFVDVFSAVIITHFWVYLTRGGHGLKDHVGTITLGGLLGGIAASVLTGWFTSELGYGVIVVFAVLVQLSLAIFFVQRRMSQSLEWADLQVPELGREAPSAIRSGNGKSQGLLLIGGMAAIFVTYELVSTVIDSVFVFRLQHELIDKAPMSAYQGKVSFYGQILALVIQLLFLTSFRSQRGLRVGLYVLPLCLLAGALGYALYPDLSMIAFTVSADIALSNSVFLSSRESLFQRLHARLRNRLKPFNEIIVRRAGKLAGAGLVIYLTLEGAALTLVTIGAIGIWIVAVSAVLSCIRSGVGAAVQAPAL